MSAEAPRRKWPLLGVPLPGWAWALVLAGLVGWRLVGGPSTTGGHDLEIRKDGVLLDEARLAEIACVRVEGESSGRCDIGICLEQARPGDLVLLSEEQGGHAVAVGEVLENAPHGTNARLLGMWGHCPPMREARPVQCPQAAAALEEIAPDPGSLGPEALAIWTDTMEQMRLRRGCEALPPSTWLAAREALRTGSEAGPERALPGY